MKQSVERFLFLIFQSVYQREKETRWLGWGKNLLILQWWSILERKVLRVFGCFGYLSRTSDGWFIVFYGLPMHVICLRHMFLITQYTWFVLPHDFMYIVRMHCLSMHASKAHDCLPPVLFSSLCQAKPKVWQRENGHVAACWSVWGSPFHLVWAWSWGI